jgi:molybdopterin-guanine dinucleotide biosynthesis protein A
MMGGVKKKIRCGEKPMTAIVLAGGRSRRMKADKARLIVGERTLLEHVVGQIAPYFDEVLISTSPGQELGREIGPKKTGRRVKPSGVAAAAARIRFVEDETPGLGPLGGILSGLKAAANEACAVIACDVPDIDIALLRSLARAAADFEIAVPVGPSGLHEPLFAVYRRSIVPEIESLLVRGERSLLPLYETCRTAIVRFRDAGRIRNLNTREDYEDYLRSLAGRAAGQPPAVNRRAKRSRPKGRI